MKLSVHAQNVLEWLAIKAGKVPTPLAYSHFGFLMSHFVVEAVDKGIFEAIGTTKKTVQQVAEICGVNPKALNGLINVLASMNLVVVKRNEVCLTRLSKKWILKDSPHSLYWLFLFDKHVCMNWLNSFGKFLETGEGLQYHQHMSQSDWMYYQKAMEATGKLTAGEAARKIPIPALATEILDIGGSHGLYSVAFCNRHPALNATILDLPEAVLQAKKILPQYYQKQNIQYLPGDILTMELEKNKYDMVIMASLSHHFTFQQNQFITNKVFKALKPGGYFAIVDLVKQVNKNGNNNMMSAMGDLYFSFSSTSGAWFEEDVKTWQNEAGLMPVKIFSFFSLPGYKAIICAKPK
jgi:ubiquinone/menaquinone biosynthesis C-methylase UbiE